MAKFLHKSDKVVVDGVDLSNFGFRVSTPEEAEQVDVSGFSNLGLREYLKGVKDQSLVIGFLQGFGSNEPHPVLSPLMDSGSLFLVYVQPDGNSGTSAANPWFGGTAQLFTYNGLDGELNARAEVEATFRPASNTAFAWHDS